MDCKEYSLLPGVLDMAAGRVGEGKNHYVVLPGLSVTPVSPYAGVLADRYGEAFFEDRSLWLVDRRREVPEDYTILQTAQDTVDALESVGVKAFDLFGASMGAMVALYIAALYPERVRRLVIASTEGILKKDECPVFDTWRRLAEEKKHTELTQNFYDFVYGEATLRKIREAGPLQVEPYTGLQLRNFVRGIDSLRSLDAFSLCGKIKCPVLVFACEGDKVFGTEGGRNIAELTGGKLVVYGKEYGHAVYDEAPDFIGQVKEFLN